jgi:hypothetical protein
MKNRDEDNPTTSYKQYHFQGILKIRYLSDAGYEYYVQKKAPGVNPGAFLNFIQYH